MWKIYKTRDLLAFSFFSLVLRKTRVYDKKKYYPFSLYCAAPFWISLLPFSLSFCLIICLLMILHVTPYPRIFSYIGPQSPNPISSRHWKFPIIGLASDVLLHASVPYFKILYGECFFRLARSAGLVFHAIDMAM